jgi:hypothetical protein
LEAWIFERSNRLNQIQRSSSKEKAVEVVEHLNGYPQTTFTGEIHGFKR